MTQLRTLRRPVSRSESGHSFITAREAATRPKSGRSASRAMIAEAAVR
jgi:hypothetical protein